MKIDPFPTSDPTMKTVAFTGPAATIADAHSLFEKSMLHIYPDCELSKNTDEDKKGIDYISGNRKISLAIDWSDCNDTYSKYTVCSKGSNTPYIFDSEADVFVMYSASKKEFLIMSSKDIQKYANDKFPGIKDGPDGLTKIYLEDSTKIVNYKDSAIENNAIHSSHKGGSLFDYFIYPRRDVLIKDYNAKVLSVPEHLLNEVVHDNV